LTERVLAWIASLSNKIWEVIMAIAKCISITAVVLVMGAASVSAQEQQMGFFVTSTGMGNGGNLGGLDGADA
jgi:hypothetical protein